MIIHTFVQPAGGIISTVFGNYQLTNANVPFTAGKTVLDSSLGNPHGIVFDAAGKLYISGNAVQNGLYTYDAYILKVS